MDADGAMARMKWVLDWMRAYGYIADDNPKHLEWAGLPEQRIDRRSPRVEVEVCEVERAA